MTKAGNSCPNIGAFISHAEHRGASTSRILRLCFTSILAIHDHVHLGSPLVGDLACISVADHEIHEECPRFGGYLNTNSVFNAMRRLLKRCWPLRPGYLSSGFKSIRLFTWRAIAALATSLRFGKKNALQNIAFTMAFNLGCLSSQCSGPDRYRVWAHETLCTI